MTAMFAHVLYDRMRDTSHHLMGVLFAREAAAVTPEERERWAAEWTALRAEADAIDAFDPDEQRAALERWLARITELRE